MQRVLPSRSARLAPPFSASCLPAQRVLPTHAAHLASPRSATCLPAQRVLSTRSMRNIPSPPPSSFGSSSSIVVREFRLRVADEAKVAAPKAAGEETSYIEAGREPLEYLQDE
ncbi:hypothetical protein FB107DRAFT_279853 [Schizophyllum commune]